MITGTSDSLPHFLTFKQEKATFEIHFFRGNFFSTHQLCPLANEQTILFSAITTQQPSNPSYQSSKDAFVAFILQIQLSHGPSHPPAVSTDIWSNTKPFLLFCQTGIILLSRSVVLPVVYLHDPVVMLLCLRPPWAHLECLKKDHFWQFSDLL